MGRKVHEKMIDKIGQLIESKNLKNGDRLPPERSLAETFDVSRNTIREALKALTEKGVLASKTGSGTFVTGNGRGRLELLIADTIEQKRHRLSEILELRKIIEPQIALLAAKRITHDELSALDKIVSRQEKVFSKGENLAGLDTLFHNHLARAAGNSVLFTLYEKLDDILSESRDETLQSSQRNRQAISLHKEIVDCLRRGDGEGAEQMMKQHMRQVKQSIIKKIKGDKA